MVRTKSKAQDADAITEDGEFHSSTLLKATVANTVITIAVRVIVAGPSKPVKSRTTKASTSSKTSSKKRQRNDDDEPANDEVSLPSPGKRRKTASAAKSKGRKAKEQKSTENKRRVKVRQKVDPDSDNDSDDAGQRISLLSLDDCADASFVC